MLEVSDIRSLLANRQTDALVATLVMEHEMVEDSDGKVWFEPYGDGDMRVMISLPYYSIDIAATWSIIKRLSGINVDISYISTVDGWMWNARFGTVWATANTAPLAICRAALLYVSERS